MTIGLRPVKLEDSGYLYRWRADNNECFFGPPPMPDDHARWIQNTCQDETQRMFIILAPQPVGTISLYDIDLAHRRAEYGRFVVERTSRGKGYGHAALSLVLYQAFYVLNLNRVYADILFHNPGGLAVARSCGFHPEGIFWEHICKEGIYRDVVRVALLRDEWYIRQQAGS